MRWWNLQRRRGKPEMKLGEKKTLYIVKKVDFGVYLAEHHNDTEDRVLLPARQVPPGAAVGEQLEVFLYKDSKTGGLPPPIPPS